MLKLRSTKLMCLLIAFIWTTVIIGSSYAYFIDSVTVTGNVVAAGNLKAGLSWKNPGETGWKDASEGAIFNYQRWEPGYTDVKYIKVHNTGNLAFQYELNVFPAELLTGRANLMDVLEVYYGENVTGVTRENYATELQYVGTLTELLTNAHGAAYGILLPEEGKGSKDVANVDAPKGSVEACMVLHMRETAGNEYQNLTVGDGFKVQLAATQYMYENDSFDHNYDQGAKLPVLDIPTSMIIEVTPVNGLVPKDVWFNDPANGVSATVPAGAKMADGATSLKLVVEAKKNSEAKVNVTDDEELFAYNVKVEGLAADNTIPVVINMGEVMPNGLNLGNYELYHVENGSTVKMTLVDAADLNAHNEFTYDPVNGAVAVAMATFSEVALVADTVNAWEGKFDYTWYDASKTELTIANADQLAGFGAIVGGMNGLTQDSFSGKTVKLIADVNLGDDEENNVANKIFYPIGYYNSEGTYERTNTAITSGLRNFEGTFDGNGHTIANFYQNTWEMKGDHDWYSPEEQYYRDGMGLFGKVYGGTVKNLTVDNFKSDGEIATTGVIAAYADFGATFENIAIANCNPRVYNIGNGGIVGCVGWYTKGETDKKVNFKNITVDNSNKISALWGSYDVACGGLVGQYYPTSGQTSAGSPKNAGVHFENCHVSAIMDVYNDVCANYQYYAYRYTGMMIGSVRENETIDGRVYPKMDGITAKNCTVNFGTWNDYYYCELVANSLASYTHDHQFSRLEQVESINGTTITYLDGTTGTVPGSGAANYVVVKQKDSVGQFIHGSANTHAECYHFVDGKVWNHSDAGTETINGVEVLKEDNQHIYLEFDQLFTGYGWGVTSAGIEKFNGITTDGVQNDVQEGDQQESILKFAKADTFNSSYTTGTFVMIGDLFKGIDNLAVPINDETVYVAVSPVGASSTANGVYTPTTTDNWKDGTLTFTGVGAATITITDYYFCKPTTIEVEITSTDKFATKFTGDFLYRVGNQNSVALGSLFEAISTDVTITEATVEIEPVAGNAKGEYTANTSDWTKGTIKFSDTGVVEVAIKDDTSTKLTLKLEVIDAKNITKAESATANDVVLLNDISGTFVVSGGHTFYGNGFTVTLPTTSVKNKGNGFTGYISIGASQDDGNANGGNLDNVRIEGPVYPEMYIYRNQAEITDKNDPDYGDGYNMRYFVNSVIVYGGNCNISNSYISGSRTALCLRGGNNVVIENTTLFGGAYANMEICAGSSVTLRDLTTVQVDVADSYGKGKTAHGLGIAVSSNVVDIYIEGQLNQFNWLNQEKWNSIVPRTYQSFFPKFFTDNNFTKYRHTLNEDAYVNLAFIFACNWDTTKVHDNRDVVDYGLQGAQVTGSDGTINGGVYSKVNTVGGNAITVSNLIDPGYVSLGFNPVAPVFKFDNTPNNDSDDANDTNDTYCIYNESIGTLKIGINGDSKILDLSKVKVEKNGTTLTHTTDLNGTQISGNSVTIKAADGAKQTLTFKATSNDAGYDKKGNAIAGSIEYTWTVTVEVAVLAFPAPVWNMGGTYKFDATTNCVFVEYNTDFGEAVPIYEGIKVIYYDKNGTKIEEDFSGTTVLPTGSNNSNSNAFTYTLGDGSTLTMKFSSGWKSGAATHQFVTYDEKVYIYPQSLDNGNYARNEKTAQDFDVKITYTFTDPNGQSVGPQTMQWYNAKGTNNNVKEVQWKTFDSKNGKSNPNCVTPDTLITLANGTQVRVDNLTGNEMLLVWNMETGALDAAPIMFVDSDPVADYEIVHLYFSDGTDVKVIYEHGFWDYDLNKYVYLDKDAAQYIGHTFAKHSGNELSKVKLTDVVIEKEVTSAWSPVTADHLCYFVNGMLSMPGGVSGLFNIFDVDPATMAYDMEALARDIETYGLFTYEELNAIVELPEEMFNAAGGAYLKVSIGKGNLTMDELIYMIERYTKYFK